jgi:hypothetical protein
MRSHRFARHFAPAALVLLLLAAGCGSGGSSNSNSTSTGSSGGVVIANGIGRPEEGFDADVHTVALKGGTAIGTGGGNSSVDNSSTAGYATISQISSGKTLAIWKGNSSAGSLVFAYQIPSAAGSTALSALVSSAALTSGWTYTDFFTTSSSVTCSEWFHGLCVGTMSAAYSSLGPGTSLTVR